MNNILSPATPVPSENWTDEERKSIAAKLAGDLIKLGSKGLVPPYVLFDTSDRIIKVLMSSPGFLEANRKSILEGKVHPSESSQIEKK